MLEKIKALSEKYAEIEYRLSQPEVYGDIDSLTRLNRERRELEPIVLAYRRYLDCQGRHQEALELLQDPELRELAREEAQEALEGMESAREELKLLLLPRDPNDDKNVIVEIRGGVGGEESALFAGDLFRMYSMYAEARGWKLEVANLNETELGGIKEISFLLEGTGAYSRLKFESGVHRVQRVPETEAQGRVHTSTCTVAVLPEMEESEFTLNPAEVQIDTFRSSGAGGKR